MAVRPPFYVGWMLTSALLMVLLGAMLIGVLAALEYTSLEWWLVVTYVPAILVGWVVGFRLRENRVLEAVFGYLVFDSVCAIAGFVIIQFDPKIVFSPLWIPAFVVQGALGCTLTFAMGLLGRAVSYRFPRRWRDV